MSATDPVLTISALSEILTPERAARLDDVAQNRLGGVVVVLENLHDPHNGGAALRSIEAMGLLEVRTVGTPLRFSERVTQGCERWLTLEHDREIEGAAHSLRKRGFRLYAAMPGASTRLEDLDPLPPAAFLIGNERAGLSAEAQAICDDRFAIPLPGFSQSLNLSVATAFIVYTHATRRRRALGRPGDLDEAGLLALRARYYSQEVRGADAIVARFASREPRFEIGRESPEGSSRDRLR
jgi:tRNA (guanosine-2'-O-)-methyltransferase